MDVVLSPASDTPFYAQIAEQIAAQIVRGELAAGAPLPPIRTVARDLGVSVITVKKAWDELERAGLIDAIVGKGSFVAAHRSDQLTDKREAMALQRLSKDLVYYRGLGFTRDEFLALARQVYPDAS
ncbi:MAG: GntR family transcriptional regulator [Propionibacteriaceae bacterium]|nr:GntR family transcriptional regulator [Propionibacteriaceae bacterium]